MSLSISCTTFDGSRRIASGDLLANALAAQSALAANASATLLTFDDATGRVIDLDTRGNESDLRARYTLPPPSSNEPPAPRGRGRPKLGVVAREVTLLPRHWEWLETQPGGASTTLRRLVEEARLAGMARDRSRQARERAYHVMSTLAGNLPSFEEASRALFAGDLDALRHRAAGWPPDILEYVLRLATIARETTP